MKRYLSLGLIALAFVAASLFTAKPAMADLGSFVRVPAGTLVQTGVTRNLGTGQNTNCWKYTGGTGWPERGSYYYCGTQFPNPNLAGSIPQVLVHDAFILPANTKLALNNNKPSGQPVTNKTGEIWLFDDPIQRALTTCVYGAPAGICDPATGETVAQREIGYWQGQYLDFLAITNLPVDEAPGWPMAVSNVFLNVPKGSDPSDGTIPAPQAYGPQAVPPAPPLPPQSVYPLTLQHIQRHELGHQFDYVRGLENNPPILLSQFSATDQDRNRGFQGYRNLATLDKSFCDGQGSPCTGKYSDPVFGSILRGVDFINNDPNQPTWTELWAEEFAMASEYSNNQGFGNPNLDSVIHTYFGCTYFYLVYNVQNGSVPIWTSQYPNQCLNQGGPIVAPPQG